MVGIKFVPKQTNRLSTFLIAIESNIQSLVVLCKRLFHISLLSIFLIYNRRCPASDAIVTRQHICSIPVHIFASLNNLKSRGSTLMILNISVRLVSLQISNYLTSCKIIQFLPRRLPVHQITILNQLKFFHLIYRKKKKKKKTLTIMSLQHSNHLLCS